MRKSKLQVPVHLTKNMYWVCIQFIVKKFPDGLFLVTPYVPIRVFVWNGTSKKEIIRNILIRGKSLHWG